MTEARPMSAPVTITLPRALVAQLQVEYPGCFPDTDSIETFAVAVLSHHLLGVRATRRKIEESRPVPLDQLTPDSPASTYTHG